MSPISDSHTPQEREAVRFLVFSASLRADSLNSRLARLAASTIEANGGIVDSTSMPALDTPSYDADVQHGEASHPAPTGSANASRPTTHS